MEKHSMLALSTGHVSDETASLMQLDNIDGVVIYDKPGYGWFVVVPDGELEMEEIEESCPKDLYECLKLAQKEGCDWIMFDSDVEAVDELPMLRD